MKQWDGIAGDLQYINCGGLYKDEESGTIYYKDSGAFCVWCPAETLRKHLHRLYQRHGEKLVKIIK